ncbi:bifunctional non-homologous end joining protein LigD [Bosea sp. OAE506]|jgi:bifunctional non-homologous end joining protein LigD|uniref:non-homologous end-joining DNA ligase n=1 Tax=Bosea sp. OAE506 TaxID=2663870 RepID=UPI00178B6550
MAKRLLKVGVGDDVARSHVVATRRNRRQSELRFDPMPERVEPCLALLAAKAPTTSDWAMEVKWDGYRLAVHIERGKVRILTRGGHDWTTRFPTIAHDALEMGLDSAILDGEAVVLDERGASDFGALQRALGGRGGKRSAAGALLYAFDLLYLDGRDLRGMALDERRDMLTRAIRPHGSIRLSEELNADGAAFLKLACELGLEGIIAKRRDAPYRSGRGGDWLKIKCVQSETFLILGYEPSAAALGGIGRLLLAARNGDSLAYVGSVGTGFTTMTATELKRQLKTLEIPKPAIPIKAKGTIWVTPTLPAEIAFRGWTNDNNLRHASYKGLREEADVEDLYEIDA